MTDNVLDLFKKRPSAGKKRKGRRKRQVFLELIDECQQTGPPDYRLIDKIAFDLKNGRYTYTDMFAVYLYRKRAER